MKYCKICVYPDTKPELEFDENGVFQILQVKIISNVYN
jgi:hypothetical protein